MASWKRTVTSGLISLVPLLVTIYLIYRLYSVFAGLIPEPMLPPELLRPWLPGDSNQVVRMRHQLAQLLRVCIGLAIFLILTLATGYLMRTTLGSFAEGIVDNVANRIPGLRIVYNASKIAAETTLGDTTTPQTAVRVETWSNHRMTAFKTGKETDDGREILFLPTAPNFTSGFVIEVESERVTATDESVEEALTRVISAGFGDTDDEQHPSAEARSDMIDSRLSNDNITEN